MADHNAWIAENFDASRFLLVGTLQPNAGGAILAKTDSRKQIEAIIAKDPFVAQDVVTPEIVEITPSRVHEKLTLLAG